METLKDLIDLANSLEWFELETEEQEILADLEYSASNIEQGRDGFYRTVLSDQLLKFDEIRTIAADTVEGIEQAIFDHYKSAVTSLALNEYR